MALSRSQSHGPPSTTLSTPPSKPPSTPHPAPPSPAAQVCCISASPRGHFIAIGLDDGSVGMMHPLPNRREAESQAADTAMAEEAEEEAEVARIRVVVLVVAVVGLGDCGLARWSWHYTTLPRHFSPQPTGGVRGRERKGWARRKKWPARADRSGRRPSFAEAHPFFCPPLRWSEPSAQARAATR